MLSIDRERRLDARSTEEMTVEEFCRLRTSLESSTVIGEYEFGNRPRRGGKIFGFVQLFLLYMLMESRKTTYRGIVSNLSDADCELMGFPVRANGGYRRPAAATLNGFVNHVLSDMAERIGDELSLAVIGGLKDAVVTIDSTPLEASRYNRDAEYSPYYEVRMDKAHIAMINGYPAHMVQTRGNAGDNPCAAPLIAKLGKLGIGDGGVGLYTDGGYDAFLTFAYAYMTTGTVMRCNFASDAVFSDVDDDHLKDMYARMWRRKDYDPHKKDDTDFVLRFLYRNGKEEAVGKYLRDVSMKMNIAEGRTTVRFICETVHRAMKRWVDFSIMRIRKATKLIRIRCRFLCVQFLSVLFKGYLA